MILSLSISELEDVPLFLGELKGISLSLSLSIDELKDLSFSINELKHVSFIDKLKNVPPHKPAEEHLFRRFEVSMGD